MGWNDRLLEDPYVPSSEYYRDRDAYEAWLEYRATLTQDTGLSSQNIDPAMLSKTTKRTPESTRRNIVARVWEKIFGQNAEQNEELPF